MYVQLTVDVLGLFRYLPGVVIPIEGVSRARFYGESSTPFNQVAHDIISA